VNASRERIPDRLLEATWQLLRLRVRISWNSFRHARTGRKIGSIVIAVLIAGLACFLFWLSWLLLGFLGSPYLKLTLGLDAAPFLQIIPALILSLIFIAILLSSFGVLLQGLYLAGDMDFLLSSPIPIRAVFLSKLLQAVLPNFGLIAVFGLPVLFGLGMASRYHLLYYPLVLLIMAVLTLAAAGLSSLLVMMVVRILPARRAAEILGFIGAILAFTLSQAGNLANSFGLGGSLAQQQVTRLLGVVQRLSPSWSPLTWGGRGLVDVGAGDLLPGLLMLGLTVALTGGTFLLALEIAERWYFSGWAGMQVATRRRTSGRSSHPGQITQPRPPIAEAEPLRLEHSRMEHLFPPPVGAIIRKDFLILHRDLRNLSQLISPLIFGLVYTLVLFRPNAGLAEQIPSGMGWMVLAVQILLTYGSVAMAMFVGWMFQARLAGMAFSAEGRNYWILKVSPLRVEQLMIAKFAVAYLPTLALGGFFLLVISILRRIPLGDFFYSLLAVTLCLAGMNGIQLAFGAAGANLNWDDPRRMNAGAMGCLGQALTLLYLPVAFSLFIGPLLLLQVLQKSILLGYLAGMLGGGLLAAACAVLPLYRVRHKVAGLAES
jgi:ABC-2 type transport system permease protein